MTSQYEFENFLTSSLCIVAFASTATRPGCMISVRLFSNENLLRGHYRIVKDQFLAFAVLIAVSNVCQRDA